MGITFSRFSHFFFKKQIRILLVGLESAGKSTIFKLKVDVVTIVPTPGFTVDTLQYKNITFTAWDVGQNSLDSRSLWRTSYYKEARAIIFVVDAADRERIPEAREELHDMLTDDGLCDTILLIFANKQDLPDAMDTIEITDALGLHGIRQPASHVQLSQAASGDGLYEGLEWMSNTIMQRM